MWSSRRPPFIRLTPACRRGTAVEVGADQGARFFSMAPHRTSRLACAAAHQPAAYSAMYNEGAVGRNDGRPGSRTPADQSREGGTPAIPGPSRRDRKNTHNSPVCSLGGPRSARGRPCRKFSLALRLVTQRSRRFFGCRKSLRRLTLVVAARGRHRGTSRREDQRSCSKDSAAGQECCPCSNHQQWCAARVVFG